MAHPHHEHRDHKVSERRLHSLYGHMPKRASGGSVEHGDEREDKTLVKSMVKSASLKASGGKVKARGDRACRRKGGKVMKRRDDGGAVDSQQPTQQQTVTTDSGATVGSGMRPNPNARYDPRTGKVKGFARGGKVKKGKGHTSVNVIVAPQGGGAPPMAPPGAMAPHPALPPPPTGAAPPMPPGAPPPMMPHKAGGRAYKKGGRVKRADGGPVGDKGPRQLPIRNTASLQRALANAEGDDDIARIKASLEKRGMDTSNMKKGGRVKRAWGGAMPGIAGVSASGAMPGGVSTMNNMARPGGVAPVMGGAGPMGGGAGGMPGGMMTGHPASYGATGAMPMGNGAGPMGNGAGPMGGGAGGMPGGMMTGHPASYGATGAMPMGGSAMGPTASAGMMPARPYKKGGAVKSGPTWNEGLKNETKVQHNDSGKTADQEDGQPSRKGMRVVTFWAGGSVKRKTGGPVFSNGNAGAQMAPKLPAGAGGGEGRLAKRKLAYGHPAKEVNGAR